jgi:RNA polymerase sigma-70 factor (ECF subfamily)
MKGHRSRSEDLALVARCKRELPHQHQAFEQLVEEYKDMIYTLCYRLSGNATDAEDLMQDILMKLFLNLQKFDGRSAFSSWLFRVAHNHCLNFLASRKQERMQTDVLPEGDTLTDAATDPSRQDQRTLAVLASMPAEERSLLVMKYVLDLDIKEMGEVLHIGLSAAKMRVARARETFKRIYAEQLPEVR